MLATKAPLSQTSRCGCAPPSRAFRDRAKPELGLVRARKLEEHYARSLRRIARHIGDFVTTWAGANPEFDLSSVSGLQATLRQYAETITPWAKATAGRIGQEIAIRERRGWSEHARLMSRARREELMNAPTGEALRAFMDEQVKLIRSLPIDAGERVHRLTIEGLHTSARASEVAKEIMRSGEVTASRATLIARTEVSRTASALTMVRAQSVGSTAYTWRTSHDSDVRPSHRKMEGRPVEWDKPPTLDGLTGHAGMLPNCRCYPEPIIPGIDD